MRLLVLLVGATFAATTFAQQPPDQNRGPYGTAPGTTPSPAAIEPPPPLWLAPVRHPPPESARTRWRRARALSISGSVVGLFATGLSLSSAVYVLATGWPPSANDFSHPAARPNDTGAILAYAGASASALGFGMTAGGLAWQHDILRELGADQGRGLFGAGVAVGVVGFLGVATSYFFGFTGYLNPHDQGVAVLASSLSGTAVCTIASIMLAKDSSNLKEVWQRLLTF